MDGILRDPSQPLDGFWLPKQVRQQVLTPSTEFTSLSFAKGRACQASEPGAVTMVWPLLGGEQWRVLLAALAENRAHAPRGSAFWEGLQSALGAVVQRFANPDDPLHIQAMQHLPAYTGYSEAMIRFMLSGMDWMPLDQMPAAFDWSPTRRAMSAWQPLQNLPGYIRFHPDHLWRQALAALPVFRDYPVFGSKSSPNLVLGYGAGNVPGTALLIAFLAQATTLAGSPPPIILVKNSRREPLFTPLVLNALEEEAPELVATTAVLIWDYEDHALQSTLLSQADLVIAAASDETIAQIQEQIRQAERGRARPIRFHAHGHKVSFSAVSNEVLTKGLSDPVSGQPVLNIVALLAALDSIFWDQHGCLSARIHFVEQGDREHYTPLEYAVQLEAQLRVLASLLPRGAWPRQQLHDRFDRYKQMETTGLVQVLSKYEDEYLVAIDHRPLDAWALQKTINDCQGRVIIVRPVTDLMEVPDHFLRLLSRRNLQSLSVALGEPGQVLQARHMRFASACAARGVTAIRSVGRGAFPQLSHSWDGWVPLDLVRERTRGYFTTIEFDRPVDQFLHTYRMMLERGAVLGVSPL